MKRTLRHNMLWWVGCILLLVVLSGTQGPAAAQQANVDDCGTLTHGIICTVISLPGLYGDEYYMISRGEFEYGDHLRVIGGIYCYPGPSPS